MLKSSPPPPPPPKKSLRICCYGSSSSDTPTQYLSEAYKLGTYLAQNGHICVNGAGSYGCMASLNEGASDSGGTIVGVIHKMFDVDSGGQGAHPVFRKDKDGDKIYSNSELMLAGGEDLQERKKLLVTGADALVVLPGGPGTWDELWEMACGKNIGISTLPIVCVNVDNYYEPFRTMLNRAYKDKLIRNHPDTLIHFEPNSQKALQWIEQTVTNGTHDKSIPSIQKQGVEEKPGFSFSDLITPTLQNVVFIVAGIMIITSSVSKRN